EKRATARLRSACSPSFDVSALLIHARSNSQELSKLAATQEAVERLDVAPKTVIVADEHFPAGARSRGLDELDTGEREGERTLAQHVRVRGERREPVRRVQMIRRAEDGRTGRID